MKRITISSLVLFWWILSVSSPAWSQQPPLALKTSPDSDAKETREAQAESMPTEEIEKRIEELKTRIRAARLAAGEQTAAQLGVTLNDLQRHIEQMSAEQSAYDQLLKMIGALRAVEEKERLLRRELASAEGAVLKEKPPYPLMFYDNLLDDLQSAEQQRIVSAMAMQQSQKAIEEITARLEELLKKKRQLKERLDNESEKAASPEEDWQLKTLETDIDMTEALLALEKEKLAKLEIETRIAQMDRDLAERKVRWVRQNLSDDENALNQQMAQLEKRKSDLSKTLKQLSGELNRAEEEWLKALKRNNENKESDAAPEAEKALKAAEEWRNTYQAMLEQTYAMLRLIEIQEDYRRRRHSLVNPATSPPENLDRWKAEINEVLNTIQTTLNLQQKYQTNLQGRINDLEKDIAGSDLPQGTLTKMKRQLAAMRKLADARLDLVSELIETEQLGQRLLNETADIIQQKSLWERFSKYRGEFESLWNYEIIQIDNNSVTSRKVVFSLLILIVGIIFVKVLIRSATGRLFRYANLKDTTAAAIQKVLLFSAYLLVFLFALRMVNIPLAAFAFLGGAVAIGVGFGAQNLINNFISGFIIMGERPISIGNLIEVDGVLGQVEEIGARCTRVRTGENIHILVPNSSFLEKNITNWTLSDQKIRTHITVGVVYGSPVRQVEELLLQAARENPQVIKPPEPFVIFREFGDNALIFEVYFWISIKRVIERRITESNIRFRIDDIFREANIVIAFPQRDIHLDTQKPLELRILDSEGQRTSPGQRPPEKD